MKIGIVGLPNVGKSTLFNALSGTNQAAASNFPFCTIEPNTGIVPVPDFRLNKLAEIEKSAKIIPTSVEFVDIAGLVAGASTGQGLGNKFLGHIREVDAIIHVVRLFEDKDIIHVSGNISPLDDAKVINLELILSDLEHLDKLEISTTKLVRGGSPEAKATLELIAKLRTHLEQELPARSFALTDKEKELVVPLQLLTIKPILYVANVAENQLGKDEVISALKNSLGEHEDVLAISAQIEAEIAGLEPNDQAEYLKSLGLTEPGLNILIRHGYHLLGLITYFTAGPQEARGWTIKQGTNAQESAGVIHTDFAKGFIRAETVSYEDFVSLGGWGPARTAGKVRSEGKTYIVADGDVLLFRFNV